MLKRSAELPVPRDVQRRAGASEIARIWDADSGLVVTLRGSHWEDPAAWGLLLVDLARHAASTYAEAGWSHAQGFARIREGLEAEWAHASDEAPPGGTE